MESNGNERMLPAHYSFKKEAKMHSKKKTKNKMCISVSGTCLDYFKSRKGPQKLSHRTEISEDIVTVLRNFKTLVCCQS